MGREDAWPQRLAEFSGRSVYNMAMGGYGPAQYLLLAAEAATLSPSLVLVGVYGGNDLFGAYRSVYHDELAPQLRSSDPAVLARLSKAETTGRDIIAEWERTNRQRTHPLLRVALPILDPVRAHSGVWGLARAIRRWWGGGRAARPGASWTESTDDPEVLLPFQYGDLRTIFTPAQRLAVLDLADPRILEGLQITLEALSRIDDRCATRCQVAIVYLPTKERVFAPLVERSGAEVPEIFRQLVRSEDRVRAELADWAGGRRIRWLDTTESLQRALERGVNPFPVDWNGHLDPEGNAIVARAVLEGGVLDERTGAAEGGH